MIIRKYNNLKAPGNITVGFGQRTKDEKQHMGVDFANAKGSPIPAFEDGVITGVGVVKNGLGNVIILKDKNGDTHSYGHLQRAVVKPGMRVRKGQEIAKMGDEGNSYSPSGGDSSHLDIRISNAYGKYKNPLNYLKNK